VAAIKAGIKGHVRDFLPKKLGAGNVLVEGVFALRGPSPYLRICMLLTAWALLPAVVLRLWKFHFLAVTRDAVVVVAISKLTLAPTKIMSITPRGQARIDDVRHSGMWTRLMFTDAAGTTHRYNISRPNRRDLDGFLAVLGAPPRPRKPRHAAFRRHTAKHGR
jgi:hypothetical protein